VIVSDGTFVIYAKSPPLVETEVSHTGFPIWRSSDPMTGSLFLIDLRPYLPAKAKRVRSNLL